jgi:hypothetical protein
MAETAVDYQWNAGLGAHVTANRPSTTRRKMISTMPMRMRAPVAAAPASAEKDEYPLDHGTIPGVAVQKRKPRHAVPAARCGGPHMAVMTQCFGLKTVF